MHATEALAEADRLMTICNSCRYCEGLCAVFPAMEMRRTFADGDLNYLANLCHGCGACYYDCQYAPPHAFNVGVPRVLAQVRSESWRAYAVPRALSGVFVRNGIAAGLATAASIAGFVLVFAGAHVLFGVHRGQGAFYAVMSHSKMALLFGLAFIGATVALGAGGWRFWRDVGGSPRNWAPGRSILRALKDAGRLRHLDGGGVGCMNVDEHPTDRRRFFHHLTFYGFMLCFASTVVATLYHYVLGREAPYGWYEFPTVLGMIGGLGLAVGPTGLLLAKLRRDPAMQRAASVGMEIAFILLLFLTGVSGLALLALRETEWMGLSLAIHLGIVLALFVTLPYGKFVHGLYRFLALVRHAAEQADAS